MSTNESDKVRLSLQRRVAELLQRELPAGWFCRAEGDGLRLGSERAEERQISLEQLYARVERQPERRRELLYSFVAQVLAGVHGILANRRIAGKERHVFPVIRHASFADRQENRLVLRKHTEETVIAYALDQEQGYVLIDEEMLAAAGWSKAMLHQQAMENLQTLPVPVRTQQIGGNLIHFISPTDGYAASRVLLADLLQRYDREKTGKSLGVAVPHQDVLILGDLHDDQGAQLLARLTYDFAVKGPVPISPLPFLYEDGELQPYIVVRHQEKGTKGRYRRE
jgi:uncharacterized protein YtpQ (UPF0354 family)